ncbi:MAG TPA: hypothetical protein VK586_13035 [Streptosporangiaceae bacterium]|nr:hypothetical protein [Streptosporangiaceae bacterium]
MIKIRYADLPAGLHVRAERSGRSTIIYLLPGLTHTERRAALLRVRSSASMGHGPHLPAAGVAAAVARDRVAATARNGAAAFRAHPLLLLPPVLIVASATLAYVMLSAVSITFPQATRGGPARSAPSGPGPAAKLGARGGPGAKTSPSSVASASPSPSGPGSSRPPGGSRPPRPGPSGSGAPDPVPSSEPPVPSPTPSPSPSNCLNLGLIGVCMK